MSKILKASDSAKRKPYKPTKEDIANLKAKIDEFKMSGDGVFHTIQGEGPRLGYPITFVRLHFCNLACSWCDTFYTWQSTSEEYWKEPWDLPISDLHGRIREAQSKFNIPEERHIYRVNFTGGEPLIQQSKIIRFLKENPKYYAEIETNGTIPPRKELLEMNKQDRVFFNCSPKLASSGNPHLKRYRPKVIETLSQTKGIIFKFVSSQKKDIDDVLEEYGDLITDHSQISIMPEGVTKEQNAESYDRIADYILEKGLATHGRLQNVLYDGAKRGV